MDIVTLTSGQKKAIRKASQILMQNSHLFMDVNFDSKKNFQLSEMNSRRVNNTIEIKKKHSTKYILQEA